MNVAFDTEIRQRNTEPCELTDTELEAIAGGGAVLTPQQQLALAIATKGPLCCRE